MHLSVTRHPPADWTASLRPEDAFADPAWLAVLRGRVSAERYWFALRGDAAGPLAGVGPRAAAGPLAAAAGHVQRTACGYGPLGEDLITPGASIFWPHGAAPGVPVPPGSAQPGPARPDAAPRSVPLPGLPAPRSGPPGGQPVLLPPALWLVHPGLASFVVGSGREHPAVVARLVSEITSWAWRRGIGVVIWPFVTEADTALAGALAGADFVAVPITQEAWLTVPEQGWAGYLRGLPPRHRAEVARERRRLADQRVASRLGGAADLAACAWLRAAHRAKYGGACDPPAELAALTALTGLADHRLVIAEAPGGSGPVPLSFGLFCTLGSDWHAMSTGADYADPRSRYATFEVLFYRAVDEAAGAGARRIGYGHAAIDAKRRRGCTMSQITAWVLAREVHARAAVSALAGQWAAAAGRTAAHPRPAGHAPPPAHPPPAGYAAPAERR